MASFFYIDLDLTPPELEISAPKYTTINSFSDIIIYGNEKLDTFQEIYAIDSKGNRKDFIFSYDNNKFIGRISFSQFPIGIATIYAKAKDSVFNESSLYRKDIEIKEDNVLSLEISINTKNISESKNVFNINERENLLDIKYSNICKNISKKETIRKISYSDKEENK
jgi:hypothetical protein